MSIGMDDIVGMLEGTPVRTLEGMPVRTPAGMLEVAPLGMSVRTPAGMSAVRLEVDEKPHSKDGPFKVVIVENPGRIQSSRPSVIKALKDEEAFEAAIAAGIFTAKGNLRKAYSS
ncbi:MAG: hypothetical protein RSD57_12420 [Comamonas sp.]